MYNHYQQLGRTPNHHTNASSLSHHNGSTSSHHLPTIHQFLDQDISRLLAESVDFDNRLTSMASLLTEVALDCVEASSNCDLPELLDKANELVFSLAPFLDNTASQLSQSDLALKDIVSFLNERISLSQTNNNNNNSSSTTSMDNNSNLSMEIYLPEPDEIETLFITNLSKHASYSCGDKFSSSIRSQMYQMTKNPLYVSRGDEKNNGNDGDEDDDMIITNVQEDFYCPITAGLFEQPIKSKRCGHYYETNAIRNLFRQQRLGQLECPVAGCEHYVHQNDLVEDHVFVRKLRIYIRQQRDRRTNQSTDVLEL